MSDISIVDETTVWIIIALLLSAGISFFIFVYHVILAYIKFNRKKIRCRDTRSYGYILGAGIVMSFELFCLLFLEMWGDGDDGIAVGMFSVILFLSPVIIWLIGFYYNKSKKL